ncbi:MAG: hypothetical protein LBB08_02525, partial [Rickettsiales bacterium]|jgi:threonyl-tRNA synthetase|nr:hypothetical protein [Rickettsiales bacterium]
MTERFGKDGFEVKEKDGAFYGPKLDIHIADSLGREWQCGTIQLDFQLPGRFGCSYAGKDGGKRIPILIHRTVYGSLGRFMGVLLEHLGGKLPVWLSPVHAVIIPISDQHKGYADEVYRQLHDADIATATRGLRVKKDYSSESMQKRIRSAQLKQVPYMIIVGEKEAASGTVSIRTRDGAQEIGASLSEFILRLKEKIKMRTMEI